MINVIKIKIWGYNRIGIGDGLKIRILVVQVHLPLLWIDGVIGSIMVSKTIGQGSSPCQFVYAGVIEFGIDTCLRNKFLRVQIPSPVLYACVV